MDMQDKTFFPSPPPVAHVRHGCHTAYPDRYQVDRILSGAYGKGDAFGHGRGAGKIVTTIAEITEGYGFGTRTDPWDGTRGFGRGK